MSRAEGRLIAFRSGLACVVDEEDADAMIAAGPWFASRTSGHIYAQRDAQPAFMHILLMGRKLVDHIDGCGLNNTRSNLRLATAGQNQANRRIAARNAAGFKGVVAHRGRWRAQINTNRTRVRLGLFDSREEAARAYDDAARAAWGEFACVNFPQGAESGALILPNYDSYRIQ